MENDEFEDRSLRRTEELKKAPGRHDRKKSLREARPVNMNAKRNAKILRLSASMTYGEIAKKLHISRDAVAGVVLRAKPGARDHENEYRRSRYRDFPHVRESEHRSSVRWYRKNRAKILKKTRARRAAARRS
jgi:hypothetical protein